MSLPGPMQISVQNFTAVRCAVVEFIACTRYDAMMQVAYLVDKLKQSVLKLCAAMRRGFESILQLTFHTFFSNLNTK